MNTYGTEVSATLLGQQRDADGWDHYAWTVTLTREGQSISFPYRMGLAHQQTRCGKPAPQQLGRFRAPMPCAHQRCEIAGYQPAAPDLYSILTSLKADVTNGETFEDWCDTYGSDTDSRAALAMYLACQDSETRSRRFFGSDWSLILEDESYV